MRQRKIIIILLVYFILISSDCGHIGGYPIAAVKLKYTNLMGSNTCIGIRSERTDFDAVIDTVILGTPREVNDFSVLIDFEENSLNYIIQILDTEHIDTISDIYFFRTDGRNSTIEDFEYRFNGVLSSEYIIYIE